MGKVLLLIAAWLAKAWRKSWIAQLAEIGPLKDRPPEMLDTADWPTVLIVPEKPGGFWMKGQTVDDLASR